MPPLATPLVSLKVITSADVQISIQNQVKNKTKVITSADAQFSDQNQVESKQKKCHHVCPLALV